MLSEPALIFQRRKSLAEQVSDTIVEAVSLGVLKPGERVVEADIASRFNVSRVPVREAFKILETQGILEGEPHRGLHVMAVDELVIDRICEARVAIETMAIRALVAEPPRVAELAAALEMRIGVMDRKVRAGDLIGVNRADIEFHSDVFVISGNRIAMTLWQAISRHVWIVFGREILSETSLSAIVGQHRTLADAILSGSEARAADELNAHILRLRRGQRR